MPNKTIYFLIDCSGSMYGPRADAVNNAMQMVVQDAIPKIRATKSADLNLFFKVLGFSDAQRGEMVFEIMPKTPLENFDQWDPIDPEIFQGGTPTGAALKAVIDDLSVHGDPPSVNDPAPAIILISDGMPNGDNPTYEEMLEYAVKKPNESQEQRFFRKALRVAVGINVDENGRQSLQKFCKVSEKMQRSGISAYYDCSEQYVDEFVKVVTSLTINLSVQN